MLSTNWLPLVEAPPDYHFTKLLAKTHSGPESEELVLQCTLNSYKASVKWFREKTEIKEGDPRFSIDKDIIGTCRLYIKNPTLADSGKYSCRIVGKEKEKNCFTKTEVTIKGRITAGRLQSMKHSNTLSLLLELTFIFRYYF